jgi:UDP-glucose 4-epimerase
MYPTVNSIIGDIRDRDAVTSAIRKVKPQIIINAAALKNVPEVEEVPMEGIKTSLIGTENIIVACEALISDPSVSKPIKILTISTDKATKPVNSYGMAKALQERLHIRANQPGLICNAVRYGNVLESRGSLIPILKERLFNNQTVSLTHPEMTRFFLTLDSSVELIKTALLDEEGGKTFIPQIKSAKIADVIEVFRNYFQKDPSLVLQGKIRPGEKLHEVLISEEEILRTEKVGNVYVIHDILTTKEFPVQVLSEELSSGYKEVLLSPAQLLEFLTSTGTI